MQIFTNCVKIVREDLESEDVVYYKDIKKIELIYKSETEFILEEKEVISFISKVRT
jgi:hypothetical protein